MPGLGTSFGRGGATVPLWELSRADCIVIMGSNMAEAHPVGFRYVVEAREKGAKVIHVDPRFTRTSAMATSYVPLRPGTDIAFLGGLIRHVLESRREFREYVAAYTNASFLVSESFVDDEVEGVFSGLDESRQGEPRYDTKSWDFERDEQGAPRRDATLEHPRSVFQILKRHFARYTPEMVSQICGTPVEQIVATAEAICAASGREKTTVFCYAVGWTQHTTGVQNIRACAILQLLLGNIGRPGGGILALRGHANIQGATDLATLYNTTPGYIPVFREQPDHASFAAFVAKETKWGAWSRLRGYLASQLKAFFGAAATEENGFGYDLLPKLPFGTEGREPGDESFQVIFEQALKGEVKGLLCLGQNPAAGGPNAKVMQQAIGSLEWMVVRDFFETETAAFWKQDPSRIDTEVFFLPAANGFEKEGSYTNTMRLLQWHDQAVAPPDECRSESWFVHQLAKRLKVTASDQPRDAALRALLWDYPEDARGDPSSEAILREINGYDVASGAHLPDANAIKDDGSTACGSWIHCGVFPSPERNLTRARVPGGRLHLGWGYAWPGNRRILYNRASADPQGKPWSEAKRLMEWDATKNEWIGPDVIDFPMNKDPAYRPPSGETRTAMGQDHHPGDAPFNLVDSGLARLFVNVGLSDGPLPVHYEPMESPIARNPLHRRRRNPMGRFFVQGRQQFAAPGSAEFPHALTTYRLTEHYLTGVMSRWLPWLAELQPVAFAEIPEALAAAKDIHTGDRVKVSTPRGEIRLKALVTRRLPTLTIDGKSVHVVGLPWHFGPQGLVKGDLANTLTAMVGDPNVSIQESKALVCNVERE